MKLEPDHVEKPLRKLRKQLGTLPPNPHPEDVHSLRTQTRRLEAAIAALVLERDKRSRRLVKLINPVRKAAGKVRDMDVLIRDVITLKDAQSGEGLVRLVEHLAKMRLKNARKLHDVIVRRRQKTRKRLKESSKLLRKRLKENTDAVDGEAAPQILITEIRHWPQLDAGNLHPFRLRIKELRYILQFAETADTKFIDRLGHVKEVIGEWHDWVELLRIATKVLDSGDPLLKRIEHIGTEKLQVALDAANQLRERYFDPAPIAGTSRRALQKAAGF